MADKTILITGAGSGIGRTTARHFLSHGWKVALLGRRAAPLTETADGHAKALCLPCDVTDAEAVTAAFDSLQNTWGHLDVLFNNAGIGNTPAPIDDIPLEEWQTLSDINISGMFITARAAFGMMRRQSPQGGRIINNGSISAHVPRPGSAPYTMSKHAVTGLTRSLSLDGRAYGIACGQIDIGNALTEMSQGIAAGIPQANGTTLEEPVMDAAHIASSVFHMASLPLDVNVQFMTVMATNMPYIGRG
ncbi:SDR family oxidoreductase [Alphaproteobacteria bacterium KMM 3653]|uniref:SDR family oxidoreductase n=1 Tax=Harenicola maris TaxID=2841044 RepID=A0AAP2G6A3_9RHOB|nr:SDR family oxidoreductase [Harenicola maris]